MVDGSQQTFGGTSAVAPLWAGIFARINAQLGRPVGFANPLLYQQLATSAFHDITSGNNIASSAPGYNAGPGWDACTGLGSPVGTALLAGLTSVVGATAGAPVGAPTQSSSQDASQMPS
jgi:kumamolisin